MNDVFAERIAAVRTRFAAKFETRIGVIESTVQLPQDEIKMEILALAHRHAHDMCGVGPTLGFVDTGKAARSVEQVLLPAVKAARALTAEEIELLRHGIGVLRSAASAEMQGVNTVQ